MQFALWLLLHCGCFNNFRFCYNKCTKLFLDIGVLTVLLICLLILVFFLFPHPCRMLLWHFNVVVFCSDNIVNMFWKLSTGILFLFFMLFLCFSAACFYLSVCLLSVHCCFVCMGLVAWIKQIEPDWIVLLKYITTVCCKWDWSIIVWIAWTAFYGPVWYEPLSSMRGEHRLSRISQNYDWMAQPKHWDIV